MTELLVVELPNAVVEPLAVVIVINDTFVANHAVST